MSLFLAECDKEDNISCSKYKIKFLSGKLVRRKLTENVE